ncbi:MAG TPA: hypothetical protein VES73_16545 [Lamprocystis sp. (in: g-proteobacteria)]|nr:hypothetical protein [Lamprocystis sp. (in: g-proteobacteria)]
MELSILQDMKSGKDVAQLLGRVLRMPYARARRQPALSRAYAHVVSMTTARAADALVDRLVDNMGFERYEAEQAVAPRQTALPLVEEGAPPPLLPVEAVLALPTAPTGPIPAALKDRLEIRPTSTGATVIVRGDLSDEVETFLLAAVRPGKQQQAVLEVIERARQAAQRAPATRGVPFAPRPQLCLAIDGALQPVERRVLADLGEFDLFAEPMSLAGFTIRETGSAFEIDVHGDAVTFNPTDSGQLHLNEAPAHGSEHDLVSWLDRECRHIDIAQTALLKWLLALVQHLTADRGLSLTALVRGKNLLAEAIRLEIDRRRQLAVQNGFQRALPGLTAAPVLADSFRYHFTFQLNRYNARPPFYRGHYGFPKHYYPIIS